MGVCKNTKKVLVTASCLSACHVGAFALFDRRFGDIALRLHAFLIHSRSVSLKVFFLLILMPCLLWAEAAVNPAPVQGQGNQQYRPANPNVLPAFDQDFFNKVGPGNEPYIPGPQVTSDVEAQIRQGCANEMNKGMGAYRNCVTTKRNAISQTREKKIDEQTTRNNLPLNNSPQLIEDVKSKSIEDKD